MFEPNNEIKTIAYTLWSVLSQKWATEIIPVDNVTDIVSCRRWVEFSIFDPLSHDKWEIAGASPEAS